MSAKRQNVELELAFAYAICTTPQWPLSTCANSMISYSLLRGQDFHKGQVGRKVITSRQEKIQVKEQVEALLANKEAGPQQGKFPWGSNRAKERQQTNGKVEIFHLRHSLKSALKKRALVVPCSLLRKDKNGRMSLKVSNLFQRFHVTKPDDSVNIYTASIAQTS